HVEKLNLIVRRPLTETMSRYLIDRIAALPNVELHCPAEIAGFEGDRESGLQAVDFRNRDTGVTRRLPLRHLFLFIGADPNTGWIEHCVTLDDNGFVLTGSHADDGERMALETSRRGVFAVGDVRAGSTKRVAAAVGEGAAAVA